jgi:hypothetical protein
MARVHLCRSVRVVGEGAVRGHGGCRSTSSEPRRRTGENGDIQLQRIAAACPVLQYADFAPSGAAGTAETSARLVLGRNRPVRQLQQEHWRPKSMSPAMCLHPWPSSLQRKTQAQRL